MRQVDAAFGDLVRQLHVDIEARTCSRYGSAEHSLHAAVVHREQEVAMAVTVPSQQEQSHHGQLADAGVQLVDDADLGGTEHMSPATFAKQLCDAATLNRDQHRPVALIALEMGTSMASRTTPSRRFVAR